MALLAIAGVLAGVAWIRGERLRAIATLKSRLALRVEGTEGLLWPTRLTNVAFDVSPNLSIDVARVELGWFPGQQKRAHGVVLRGRAPLDTFWEEARRFAVPADFEVMDARIDHTDPSGRKLSADVVSFEPGTRLDHLHLRSLRAFGTTFGDLHSWVSRPSTALQVRLARDPDDSKAVKLAVSRSPREGVEWVVDTPSQPFSEWAGRMGLEIDETWAEAVVVSIGSVIVPDSPAYPARANFRFTLDNWHRPSWPEATLLTGRSGAIALRISPGPAATQAITRVEVAAGLFSLVGSGQLSFGQPTRLAFDAHGELSCARLLAHLPASAYRSRVQAYLVGRHEESAIEPSVRLELAVRAEAPRGLPLKFRWHLHAGCGLPEMNED
ncbi:MAG: hypothetical protein ABUL60_32990 [Myxococcales bacterium]